jgi:hypothetical protein
MSPPPRVELPDGTAVVDSAETEVETTEGSPETGIELAAGASEASANETEVVMTDGSPETGAELASASVGEMELSEAMADVTVA